MDELFDHNLVPHHYWLCYVERCPQKDNCMRHKACSVMTDTLTHHPCVLPTAIADGRACPYFKPVRVMRGAWGFNTIFKEVKQKDCARLRDMIKAYLGGHGTYYRYHRGERLLTEEQQQYIKDVFVSNGYTMGLEFDGYRMSYEF